MLMSIPELRALFSEPSRPAYNTVRAWVTQGVIPPHAVCQLGRKYYISVNRLPQPLRGQLEELQRNAAAQERPE